MTLQKSYLWPAAIAVALIQTAVLGWMVYGRISLLKTGREMTVEVIPVDPRDFFRGDYVILGYPFTSTGELKLPVGTRKGDSLYATLKPDGASKWSLVSVAAAYPDKVDTGNIVL